MCPGFLGVGCWMITVLRLERITSSVPNAYPAEFRRKVLDLVAAGRPVAQVAAEVVKMAAIFAEEPLLHTDPARMKGAWVRSIPASRCMASCRR